MLEDNQAIGRIRYASERTPGIWIWNIQVHVPGGCPMGTSIDLETAKADFKATWLPFKEKHAAELPEAYKAMNIRNRG